MRARGLYHVLSMRRLPPDFQACKENNMVAHHGAPKQIVIVGGGLSGTALAIKLLRNATQPLAIRLVEPAAEPGRGLAYSTQEHAHLVNGPALLFTLYPDDPEHFSRWLAA